MEKEKKDNLKSIKFSDSEIDLIQRCADRNSLSFSSYVRFACMKYIREIEKINPKSYKKVTLRSNI